MRKEIELFAEAMEEIMQKHDPSEGDSWREMSVDEIIQCAWEHENIIGEAFIEPKLDIGLVKHECVDIANFYMMLFNKLSESEGCK